MSSLIQTIGGLVNGYYELYGSVDGFLEWYSNVPNVQLTDRESDIIPVVLNLKRAEIDLNKHLQKDSESSEE